MNFKPYLATAILLNGGLFISVGNLLLVFLSKGIPLFKGYPVSITISKGGVKISRRNEKSMVFVLTGVFSDTSHVFSCYKENNSNGKDNEWTKQTKL